MRASLSGIAGTGRKAETAGKAEIAAQQVAFGGLLSRHLTQCNRAPNHVHQADLRIRSSHI